MESPKTTLKSGLSNKIKVPIIILTFITLATFGVLFIKIAGSVSSPDKNINSQEYLLHVGDKLKNNGLYEQAIDQYIKYLDKTKSETLSRTIVSHTVGELYIKLDNCQEALVWLFMAETARSTYQRANELEKHIDTCLTQVNSLDPRNLTTR